VDEYKAFSAKPTSISPFAWARRQNSRIAVSCTSSGDTPASRASAAINCDFVSLLPGLRPAPSRWPPLGILNSLISNQNPCRYRPTACLAQEYIVAAWDSWPRLKRVYTSPTASKTIGIVEVALFAASAGGVPPIVTITSTLRSNEKAAGDRLLDG